MSTFEPVDITNPIKGAAPDQKQFEALDNLGDKLRAIAEKNQDKLDGIHSRLNDRVISGYTYALDSKMSKDSETPWSFSAVPVRNLVASCLEAYEYKGEPLEEVFDVFNDKIDWTMKTTSDVLRLNKELCCLGSKYADLLPDRPKSRASLKKITSNLDLVSSAIDEIDLISKDCPDKISEEIVKDLEQMQCCYKSMMDKLSKVNVSVQVTEYVGFGGTLEDVVKFEDPQTIAKKVTLEEHKGDVTDIVYYEINDKNCMASASRDHNIKLWDLTDNSVMATLEGHESVVNSIVKFELDGKPCLASGSFDHTVKLWDLTTNSLISTLTGHTHYVYSLASFLLDDVPCLASGGCDKTIRIWNLQDGSLMETLESVSPFVYSLVSYKHDDKTYLASGGNNNNVTVWDLKDKKDVMTLAGHDDDIRSLVTYKTNGLPYLASASQDGTIKLWNINDGSVIATLPGHSGEVTLTVFTHSDLPALGSGDVDGTIKFYNLSTNEIIKSLEEVTGPVITLAVFNHTNKPNMAIGTGNTIELWE